MSNLSNITAQSWNDFTIQQWYGLKESQWDDLYNEACIPKNTFGPPTQTVFLGCSVASFTTSIGWNEQVGDLTVQLVKDTCAAPEGKIYWDTDLNLKLLAGADPGFVGESVDIIGSPVYFRVGNFEYSGIVQSWEEVKSESSNSTYIVKISDPRQLLEGAQ